MKRRLVETAARAELVDPLAILDRRAQVREQETAAARTPEMTYEVELDPPVGAQVARLTVAGGYRDAVPIVFDHGTRTAYPIRDVG